MDEGSGAVPMAQSAAPSGDWREAAKQARRARIVAAADALAREQGFEAVAMTAIAARAEVSPATLYNLFRSRSAILAAVFDADLAQFEHELAVRPAESGVERIFAAVELAAALYARDPDFYRAMPLSAHHGGGLRPAIREPRIAFWQTQAAAARADGGLRAESDSALVGMMLAHLLAGVFQDWAAGAISARRLELEAAYGFALLLLPVANPDLAPALERRLTTLAAALAAEPRGVVAAGR